MASIAMEEYKLSGDSKYRSFMSLIDKALRAFDYTTEWADLIAALGKLNKVLVSHMKFPIIPRRIIISKRLAQCMHPALPAGVHLKALETYDIIFKSMGTSRLAQELFLYSAGLFPLMGNAAMSVRPLLLTIFETHFVSLGSRLRPGLNGILTGILPGLEEGSDHFERISNLLLSICDSCGPVIFYTSLWKCISSNYSIRLPAISFILCQVQKSFSPSSHKYLFGRDSEIVCHALSQSVQDSNVLVQRCTLELLIHMFPIHDATLSAPQLINVMTSSLSVILRRDMSLNRRFFSWLIGHEDGDCCKLSDNYSYYFKHYTQQSLIESLIQFLKQSMNSSLMDLRPFRLLMTLFEKPVISAFILDDLIIEVFRTLYHFDDKYCKTDSESAKKGKEDFARTTNLLVGSLEINVIWDFCGKYFEKVLTNTYRIKDSHLTPVNHIGSTNTSIAEICHIINFLLDTLSIDTYIQTHSRELPLLFKRIIDALLKECSNLKADEIMESFTTCRRILSKIHPSINENNDSEVLVDSEESIPHYDNLVWDCFQTFTTLFCKLFEDYFFSEDNKLESLFLKTFFCASKVNNSEEPNSFDEIFDESSPNDTHPVSSTHCSYSSKDFDILLDELKCTRLRLKISAEEFQDALKSACDILTDLSSLKIQRSWRKSQDIPSWLKYLVLCSCFLEEDFFGLQLHSIQTFLEIISKQEKDSRTLMLISDSVVETLCQRTVVSQIIGWRLWIALGSEGIHDLNCVDFLHRLHAAMPHEDLMEKAMSQTHDAEQFKMDYFKKFTLFWRLSRDVCIKFRDSNISKIFDFCLFKLLDNLNAETGPLKTQSQCWILHAITHGDVLRIFEPLFLQLLDSDSARISVLHAKIYLTNIVNVEKSVQSFRRSSPYSDVKIYAIHPRDGDIKYHISGDLSQLNRSKKMKHALYLSSFEDNKICSDDIFSNTDTVSLSTLSSKISVNPFALVPSCSDGFESYITGFESDKADPSVVHDIIDEIIEDVVSVKTNSSENGDFMPVHPLHSHILLYTQVFDSKLILYTLQCIKNIILANPRMVVCTLSTSNLSSAKSSRNNDLQIALAKHRKSVFGNNFFGKVSDEDLKTYRNSTLIEILMSMSLYFIRSYYPNLGHARLTPEEIIGNRNIQLLSVEILVMITSELIHLVSINGKAYASFVSDLLGRFKVQKIILHSLLTSVHDSSKHSKNPNAYFTNEILNFNNVGCSNFSYDLYLSTYNEVFQVQILKLTLSTIMLEQKISSEKVQEDVQPDQENERKRSVISLMSTLKYMNDCSIPEQPLFLTAIISALSQIKIRHIHSYWTSFVISSLPFLGPSLNYIVSEVIAQIIANVEEIILKFEVEKLPVDYVIGQIEALTSIIHYCLIDLSFESSHVQPFDIKTSQYVDSGTIFNNLLHAFAPNSEESSLSSLPFSKRNAKAYLDEAQKSLLSNLPALFTCIMKIWTIISSSPGTGCQDFKKIKTNLLDLFSPIAHHYASFFISSVAITWQELRTDDRVLISFEDERNASQEILINFVECVHTMPIAIIINTIRQIIKSPPAILGMKYKNDIQVLVLHFFYSYMSKFSASSISVSWPELASLTKECLGLSPQTTFLSLAILNQFVLRANKINVKKDVKEIQDLSGKIIDQCAVIGGSRLETKTWLQRNFIMSKEVQVIPESHEETADETDATKTNQYHAVTALNLLGDILANFLDVIYQSDEKEKVLPLLQNVMNNVIPYLRNHTPANKKCFFACSRLLAGLSEYQYTRKAWRKEAFELLMDPAFFQIDTESFQHWKTIVDNMMTHDNTTFKELMSKLGSIGQSGSLNLFANKEAEIEQKALCLKRLAFVIFCSELDQYYKYMPDIQERLAECLRMVPNSPDIQSVVFLCFRVILIRMSQQHLTSLWPLIITEMVQIFSYMEQELSTDTEEWSSHLKQMSVLDTNWVMTSGSNSLAAHNNPAWTELYLSACKLLDLALVLPAQRVPQFQMYRWAFVNEVGGSTGEEAEENKEEAQSDLGCNLDFVPYAVRVAKLIKKRDDASAEDLTSMKGSLKLTMKSITCLNDLAPFFISICECVNPERKRTSSYSSPCDIDDISIDDTMIGDFVESFANKPIE